MADLPRLPKFGETLMDRLETNPRAPLDAASVSWIDDAGNAYDNFGQKMWSGTASAQPQSWSEWGINALQAPVRIGASLLDSINPYHENEHPITEPDASNWRVPPLATETWNAISAPGRAYYEGMSPEEMQHTAATAAGLMMGGGGITSGLESAAARGGVSLGDRVMAKYLDWKHPNTWQTPTPDVSSSKLAWRYGADLNTNDILQRYSPMEVRAGNMFGEPDLSKLNRYQTELLNKLTSDDARYADLNRRSMEAYGVGYEGLTPTQTRHIRDGIEPPKQKPSFSVIDGGLAANASKEAGAGALANALDMSPEARLARAREMGFDTDRVLYHGTGKTFDEFNPGTRGNGSQRRIYLTDNPDIADIYANSENYGLKGGGDPMIYPVFAKAEKPLIVSDKGADGSFGWVSDNLAAALGVERPGPGKYASLYEEAKRQGYDQVQIREMTDLGGPQTQYIPLKPEYIRSVNAAFDPSKSDSSNLLAANADGRPGVMQALSSAYAPDNSLYMFGGRNAKTADLAKLSLAEELAAKGADRNAIWNETGWFQGPDQKWRFEIDDSGAKPAISSTLGEAWHKFDDYPALNEVVSHDALFSAYPSIGRGDVKLLPKSKTDVLADYDAGTYRFNRESPPKDVLESSLHEAQHAIQDVEQFSRPGRYQNLTDDEYLRGAHEVEARNVQKRMNMNADERKATPPWETQDIPDADQIVRLYSNASKEASLPALANALDERPGIIAYHGSPHDFDKFDLSKIGTGEGAQAYGHGLYFAENEGVAKSYSGMHGAWELVDSKGRPSARYGSETKGWLDVLGQNGGDYDRAIAEMNDLKTAHGGQFRNNAERGIKQFEQWKSEGLTPRPLGHTYQVRINANPEDFLDWDKPLSQQSEKVRDGTKQALLERGLPKQIADYLAASDRSARDAMSALARGVYDTRLNVPDGEMAAQASSKLREAGIPGIRYLDQMSRGAGDGSRNLVVFDDNLIEILKKYGWLAPGANLGSNALSQGQDNQY